LWRRTDGAFVINTLVILNAVALLITCIVCVTFFANAWRIGNFDASTEPRDYTRFLISVIIPARNEEMDLRQTLHSVLNQEGVRLEVIVINDHSDDRTGAIAEAVAAEDGRVTVIHDPPLKPGWLGKCNALEHGRQLASGDYIILSDADIDHHPRCFSSAMEHFERHDLDLFSLFPLIICESLWENIFLPEVNCAPECRIDNLVDGESSMRKKCRCWGCRRVPDGCLAHTSIVIPSQP
jgi:glycosyltransferase involved in cell wall biosynthesis